MTITQIDPQKEYLLIDLSGRALCFDNQGAADWYWAFVGDYVTELKQKKVRRVKFSHNPFVQSATLSILPEGASEEYGLYRNTETSFNEGNLFWGKVSGHAKYPRLSFTAQPAVGGFLLATELKDRPVFMADISFRLALRSSPTIVFNARTAGGLQEWEGIYWLTAGRDFYPLLIQAGGDVYLKDTKLTYNYDILQASLSFPPQTVGKTMISGQIQFTTRDGKKGFTGSITPTNSSAQEFAGVELLKTHVWGAPTGPIGKLPIGDHTWVSMNDHHCWNVLGGGYAHYCQNQWKQVAGRWYYDPPEGRLIDSSAAGHSDMVSCMGGKEGNFLAFQTYAEIIYGLQGVCHQMANRLLLGAGGFTVQGGASYEYSVAFYGVYSLSIPGPVWEIMKHTPEYLKALSAYAPKILENFRLQQARCRPNPAKSENDGQQKLIRSILELYETRNKSGGSPETLDLSLLEHHALHSRERALYFEYKAGNSIPAEKLGRLLALYSDWSRPSPDLLAQAAEVRTGDSETLQAALQEAGAVKIDVLAVATAINLEIIRQQQEAANLLTRSEYEVLFGSSPDLPMALVDPRIMAGDRAL
jgi:hypothetical protein